MPALLGSLRRYQILLLGPDADDQKDQVLGVLETRVKELGDGIWDVIDILEGDAAAYFDKTAPVFAVWFGSSTTATPTDLRTLENLRAEAKPILPIVRNNANFVAQTPATLHAVNGLELDGSTEKTARVANTILEGLQLLRRRRRVFVSYARRDSRAVAKQLFGSLAERGFDVFLDTHSIPAAANFQNQLWHSMVDSDVVVLLDSNGVESSRWCREEYERADALSIGVVRVLWPDRIIDPATDALLFSYPVRLTPADFLSGAIAPGPLDELSDIAIAHVAEAIEGFRARSIAARQANLLTTFKREAARAGIPTSVQVNSHIVLLKPTAGGRTRKIAVVPTIGVPVSTNYHEAFLEYDATPPDCEEQVILYNRQGFLPSWADHLVWLNGQLPIKGIDVTEVSKWLSTL